MTTSTCNSSQLRRRPAGDVKAIDAKRAQRLARTGYVRILDAPEAAVTPARRRAARPQSRGIRPERRG
jgi:hypothetical protein